MVDRIFAELDWRPDERVYLEDKPVGVKHRAADTSRAADLLDWSPAYDLAEGLRETVDWYTSTHDREAVRADLQRRLHER